MKDWYCVCVQQEVAPPSTFLWQVSVTWAVQEPRVLPALLKHACSFGNHMGISEPFNRSKAISSESQLIGLLYSHRVSAFWIGIIYLRFKQKMRHKMVYSEKSPTPILVFSQRSSLLPVSFCVSFQGYSVYIQTSFSLYIKRTSYNAHYFVL